MENGWFTLSMAIISHTQVFVCTTTTSCFKTNSPCKIWPKNSRLLIISVSLLFFATLDLIWPKKCSSVFHHSCSSWKWHFFSKKNSWHKFTKKRFIKQPKQIKLLWNKKFLKAYDLLSLILYKKLFFVLCIVHTDPCFVHKLGPNLAIIRGFCSIFIQNWISIKFINSKWDP